MMDPRLQMVVKQLAQVLKQRRWMMATAESCTGGMIAETCTDLSGSSSWFDSAIVSYSNQAKTALLGVDASLIERHGAVSKEVAEAMARGILDKTGTDLAVAVTGIAGPDGGTEAKPVGTVWIAWSFPDEDIISQSFHFEGNRQAVRKQTVEQGLAGLLDLVKKL